MAQTKNALIRYKTIDKCLQNTFRKWTLQDLIDACSDALYEYEGKDNMVSKRTVQLDIQLMRSDKLGYNAPIEVYNKKYYKYAEPNFSITKIPVTENDLHILEESVEVLKQFKEFSLFDELQGVFQRLEDKVYMEKKDRAPIIHLEKNEYLKGLEHLDFIYQAILNRICINLNYKSFKSTSASTGILHPYILKEFNNRWFVVGRMEGRTNVYTFALDRIVSMKLDLSTEYIDENFDGRNYYKDTIGVTVLGKRSLETIDIWIDKLNAPYVITKPLHQSQEIIEERNDGSKVIRIRVHHNYEVERLILGFANSMEVLKPNSLRRSIKRKLKKAVLQYVSEEK